MTRIAVLGTSAIAARAVLRPAERIGGVDVVVVGRDPQRTAQFASENGVAQWSTSRHEVFHRGDVEAAYIALPNALHAEAAVEAMRAGLDVLIEKPVCLSAAELERIAEAADAANAYVREAVMIAHHPWLDHLAALVQTGPYGKAISSRTEIFFQSSPERIERMPATRNGGGAFYDVMSYWLTIARRTLGLDVDESTIEVLRADHAHDLEIRARLVLRAGQTAELLAGFGQSKGSHEISFERGTVRIAGFFGPVLGPAMLQVIGEDDTGERSMKLFRPVCYYDTQLSAFLTGRTEGVRGSAGLRDVAARMQVAEELISTLLMHL